MLDAGNRRCVSLQVCADSPQIPSSGLYCTNHRAVHGREHCKEKPGCMEGFLIPFGKSIAKSIRGKAFLGLDQFFL